MSGWTRKWTVCTKLLSHWSFLPLTSGSTAGHSVYETLQYTDLKQLLAEEMISPGTMWCRSANSCGKQWWWRRESYPGQQKIQPHPMRISPLAEDGWVIKCIKMPKSNCLLEFMILIWLWKTWNTFRWHFSLLMFLCCVNLWQLFYTENTLVAKLCILSGLRRI